MELKDFTQILTKSAILMNHGLSEIAIVAWYELFFNEPKELFAAALNSVIKEPNRRFFPTPGEVTAALDMLKNPSIEQAGLVWERLLKHASRSLDFYQVQDLEGSNPAAMNAIRQIEWDKIRYANLEKELPIFKAQFIKFYNQFNEQDKKTKALECNQHEQALLKKLGFGKRQGALAA